MQGNTGSGVWADAAYRSEEMEAKLRDRKLKSHIHRKGNRGKPLTDQAKGSNRTKSTVRVRVEHTPSRGPVRWPCIAAPRRIILRC
jgi:IS5 family transposase